MSYHKMQAHRRHHHTKQCIKACENSEFVRRLLQAKQPEFAAALAHGTAPNETLRHPKKTQS